MRQKVKIEQNDRDFRQRHADVVDGLVRIEQDVGRDGVRVRGYVCGMLAKAISRLCRGSRQFLVLTINQSCSEGTRTEGNQDVESYAERPGDNNRQIICANVKPLNPESSP